MTDALGGEWDIIQKEKSNSEKKCGKGKEYSYRVDGNQSRERNKGGV